MDGKWRITETHIGGPANLEKSLVDSPMHERSLVNSLLRQVSELQARQHEGRVIVIRVTMGEFSGVDADLFTSAFEELVESSPVRGASLELTTVPLTAFCSTCEQEFVIHRFRFICPFCSNRRLRVVRGEGLQLENIVMETAT